MNLPFSEVSFESLYEFMQYVVNGNRPAVNKDCPKHLSRLIANCWAQDNKERPPFSTIVEKLDHILKKISKDMPEDIQHVTPRVKTEVRHEETTGSTVEAETQISYSMNQDTESHQDTKDDDDQPQPQPQNQQEEEPEKKVKDSKKSGGGKKKKTKEKSHKTQCEFDETSVGEEKGVPLEEFGA